MIELIAESSTALEKAEAEVKRLVDVTNKSKDAADLKRAEKAEQTALKAAKKKTYLEKKLADTNQRIENMMEKVNKNEKERKEKRRRRRKRKRIERGKWKHNFWGRMKTNLSVQRVGRTSTRRKKLKRSKIRLPSNPTSKRAKENNSN